MEPDPIPAPPGFTFTDDDLKPEYRKIVAEFDRRVKIQIRKMATDSEKAEMPQKLSSSLALNVLMHYAAMIANTSGIPRESFLAGTRIHYDLAFEETTDDETKQR